MTPIPIFIISFNRANMLSRCLDSLKHFTYSYIPIIHDNGSQNFETLQLLGRLESEGVKVYRSKKIITQEGLNSVNESIKDYFNNHPMSNYVVTDCDIDVSTCKEDTLQVFSELLQLFPECECVGPMLKISDVDKSYPLYNKLMNGHITQFWSKRPSWVSTSFGEIAYQECQIDTTFALHRSGQDFKRLKSAIRVYNPYEAKHLDWYPQFRDLDKEYRLISHPNISHWNNSFRDNLDHIRGEEKLKFTSYYLVTEIDGKLIEIESIIS